MFRFLVILTMLLGNASTASYGYHHSNAQDLLALSTTLDLSMSGDHIDQSDDSPADCDDPMCPRHHCHLGFCRLIISSYSLTFILDPNEAIPAIHRDNLWSEDIVNGVFRPPLS